MRAQQWAYTASFLATLAGGTVVGGSLGALAGGRLVQPSRAWTIEPGVLWSVTVARRWFGQRPPIPYLLVVGNFSGSSTQTRAQLDGARAGLHAFDLRADLNVGWTLGEAFSPYLAVRGFGGPVLWRVDGERVIGTDLYHVSVAAGFNLAIADRVGLYFDGAFVGLRSLGGGASVRF